MGNRESAPELLSLSQASQYTGAGMGTLERWLARGYIRAYVLPGGTHRRLKRSELDALLGNLEEHPGPVKR